MSSFAKDDGLDAFEKALAADHAARKKSEREGEEHRHHKHRHHHHHGRDDGRNHEARGGDREKDKDENRDRHRRRHRRHRDESEGEGEGEDEDGHRHKRGRRSRDDDDEHRHRPRHLDGRREDRRHKTADAKEDPPLPNEEKPPSEDPVEASKTLVRDAWMAAPSAFEVEHVRRPGRSNPNSPPPESRKRAVHSREINSSCLEDLNSGKPPAALHRPADRTVDYKFGDAGSTWRVTKLKAVYTAAEEAGRPVEAVALERYGSLAYFDDAREEMEEMEKRRLYGEHVRTKDQPTGELNRERMKDRGRVDPVWESKQGEVMPEKANRPAPIPMDQTGLNRLRAQMMKAKLRRAPNAAHLEEEYNRAAAGAGLRLGAPEAVVLGVMESRQLAGTRGEVKAVATKRGRERGLVEENAAMSVDDMVREERRTKGQAGGEGARLAERIAKDGQFDDNLEYMDENAEKLAKRVHRSEVSLKNMAVGEFQKISRILENCPLCHKEDRGLPPWPHQGGAAIVPVAHRKNLLECDDDEWEELRNFMKSLTRMYHEQGREVIFYENAASPHRHPHAAMMAVPIPYAERATAPAHFKEAFLSADDEWAQHRKVIDTGATARAGMGRTAFRRCIAKEMPYFHAWFTLDGGLGHVVENAGRWPKGDLFAREVIGGIVDAEPHVVKKQGRWTKGDPRVPGFRKGWRKFDWTRVLAEG